MGDWNNLAWNNTYNLQFSTDTFLQSDSDWYMECLCACRDAIKEAATMIIRANWHTFTHDSDEFLAVQSKLQDTIDRLGQLGVDPLKRGIDIDTALSWLYEVVRDLYVATARSSERNFNVNSPRFAEIGECHKYLNKIARLLSA